MMRIARADIEQHTTRQSCWVAIHGGVYDVTDFLDSHPGGPKVILRCAGKDATEDFDSVHSPELLKEALPETALLGSFDPVEFQAADNTARPSSEPEPKLAEGAPPPLSTLLNLHDFEKVAQKFLPANAWAYYSSGADDEITKRTSAKAYQKIALRPRILRSIRSVDTSTSILGQKVSLPVYMSASGLAKFAHPDGECALAAAAGREGIAQLLANSSSMSVEQVTKSKTNPDQPLFMQLYVNKDIKLSVSLVERAIKAGVKGFWITVDSPVVGKRELDERLNLDVTANDSDAEGEGVAKVMASSISPWIDWSILKWIRERTDLPVVIKGIQCVEDAVLAYEHGVQGIVLSNHGGRSQDTAQAPLLTLLEIRKFAPHLLDRKMQIFIDGGIRRGTDVLKALALGATAVGMARPFLFSISAGYGEKGARRVLQILRHEIESNMIFLGATKLSEVRPEMLNTAKLERDMIGSVKL